MNELKNIPALPEGMAELLEQIPVPPLPLEAIDALERTDLCFFATYRRELSPTRTYAADLARYFEDSSNPFAKFSGRLRYLGCGLRGHGLQGTVFEYLLDAGSLRLGLSLPWDRAYGDPEEERALLESGFKLMEVCQLHLPESGLLTVFLEQTACTWSFAEGAEETQQGDSVSGLLDFLQSREQNVHPMHWIQI